MPSHEITDAAEHGARQAAEQQRQRIEQRAANAQDVTKPGDRQVQATDQADPRIVEQFTDKAGRQMSVRRTSEYDNDSGGGSNGSRFYELLYEGNQAGRMSLSMERSREYQLLGDGSPDAYERVKLVDIHVNPAYRNAGSSEHLLGHAENEAMRHHAREIYGAVTEQDAASYWRHMSKDGWQLRNTPGEGTTVHKSMSH
ncbi:MAG: GNAT family N-acetyltransferase [Caldilinea sp.]|nr:GNAT family N-acetyltransferase [Caldilinea sp.]MCB0057824.1 GNAT family N-acetyltransferase [Caldilineaceae bacterium]HRW46811.1 GNAT family N-acetyltransferase [Caldilinea sp.]